jgi:hypothetical protein
VVVAGVVALLVVEAVVEGGGLTALVVVGAGVPVVVPVLLPVVLLALVGTAGVVLLLAEGEGGVD